MNFSSALLPPAQEVVTPTVTVGPGFPQNIPGWPSDVLWLNFLLTVLLFAALSLIAYWILFSLLRSLTYRSRRRSDDIMLNTVRMPLLIFLITFGVLRSLEVLELDRSVDNFLMTIFWVVVIATAFYLAWRIIQEVILSWLRHHVQETDSRVDDILVPLLNTLGPLIFSLAALGFIMSYLGIDVSLFLVSIGAAGLILGLAFQDSLSNLFSGVYLLINPPFFEDDMIILSDGTLCTVRRVGLRMTQLYNLEENSLMFVPNNKLAGETIINITKPNVDLAGMIKVRTWPSEDPHRVKELLNDIGWSHRHILGTPAKKIAVLRKRIEGLAANTGQPAAQLKKALTDLASWDEASDTRDVEARQRLRQVRLQLSKQVDSAEAALRAIQPARVSAQRDFRQAVENLYRVLQQTPSDSTSSAIAVDETRMQQLGRSFDQVVAESKSGVKITRPGAAKLDLNPLTTAMAAIGELDHRENQLEATLVKLEQEREAQFNHLTAAVTAAASAVGAVLTERGQFRESSYIELWSENLVIAYAEQELDYAIAGLDRELEELTGWLADLETGGISREERNKIRALFSGWGGLVQLDKRRIDQIRRYLLRWLALKEEDQIEANEYQTLIGGWERRLRALSRKLLDTREGDEEQIDTRLHDVRAWLYSENFREKTASWKMPGPGFLGWLDQGLEFAIFYYVDNIRLSHYIRRAIVAANLRQEVFDIFKWNNIEVPFAELNYWVPGGGKIETDGNGRVRMAPGAKVPPGS